MAATNSAAWSMPAPKRDQRRAGAEAGQSPADAEHRAACHQARIDVAARRQLHRAAEEGASALAGSREGEVAHQDRAAHDEGERRVPAARDVEEADHLARVGHAGDDEPDAEHQAGGESGERVHIRCLVTKTVAMPAAMNAPVATSERGDRRDSPHTPWPLVQPAP